MRDAVKLKVLIEDYYQNTFHQTSKGLAYHLLANGVTFATDNHVGGKWIPVTERLPKNGEVVLCNTIYFVEVLQWAERVETWCGQYQGYHKSHVTHWMPLPEPPKEGE